MDFREFRRSEFERRDFKLQGRRPMKLIRNDKNKLHIVYVITWVGICGGSKIVMQHCNKLVEEGHNIK